MSEIDKYESAAKSGGLAAPVPGNDGGTDGPVDPGLAAPVPGNDGGTDGPVDGGGTPA